MPTRFSRSIKAHLLRHAINEQVTRRVRPASCNACRQVTQLEAVDDAGGKSEIVLGAAPKTISDFPPASSTASSWVTWRQALQLAGRTLRVTCSLIACRNK